MPFSPVAHRALAWPGVVLLFHRFRPESAIVVLTFDIHVGIRAAMAINPMSPRLFDSFIGHFAQTRMKALEITPF
jgi:hypothetical protein